MALALVAVGLDLLRKRRRLWVPRPLVVPLVVLALAMVAGVVTGHAAGATLRFAVTSEHVLVLPAAAAARGRQPGPRPPPGGRAGRGGGGPRDAQGGARPGRGRRSPRPRDRRRHDAHLLRTDGQLADHDRAARHVAALVLARRRRRGGCCSRARCWSPAWCSPTGAPSGSPRCSGSRSWCCWAPRPAGRRLLVPASLALAVAVIWLLGSVGFQSQLPLVHRVASLAPTKLEYERPGPLPPRRARERARRDPGAPRSPASA